MRNIAVGTIALDAPHKAGVFANIDGDPARLSALLDELHAKGVTSLFSMGNLIGPKEALRERAGAAPSSERLAAHPWPESPADVCPLSVGSLECFRMLSAPEDGGPEHFCFTGNTFRIGGQNEIEVLHSEHEAHRTEGSVYDGLIQECGLTAICITRSRLFVFSNESEERLERLPMELAPDIIRERTTTAAGSILDRYGGPPVYTFALANVAAQEVYEGSGGSWMPLAAPPIRMKPDMCYVLSPSGLDSGYALLDEQAIELFR